MAPTQTVTKLSLSRWAAILGLHPLHFQQVRLNNNPHCQEIYFQYSWQTADHVSREEIAMAIREAEDKVEQYLGYRLAPSWEVDEWRPTIRPYRRELFNLNSADIRGAKNIVEANWGYFISGGVQAKDLIEASAAIIYTDTDNDGYFETATVTANTNALDKNEICIFYPGEGGNDEWEIKPIRVTIELGVATIVFRRELAVIPEKIEALDIEGAEAIGTEDADFLEEVDVYRRYNDPQSQASFLWEPLANGGGCSTCSGSGCSLCSYATQTGCLIVRNDPRLSLVGFSPAEWDADALDFSSLPWAVARQPDIVRLYYYAGWRDKRQQYVSRMSSDWERTITYMSAAMLDRPPCDCAKGDWMKWRQDLTLIRGDADADGIFREPGSGLIGAASQGITNNPFGTRRGEVFAWHKVLDLAIHGSANLRA